uniref:Lysozyme g n=1 Tax=Mola mola TaxID=94237 RepID=A0A3Q3XKZ7_MOLML
MDVNTTGASAQTAAQDKLGISGVRASQAMAKTDAGRMEKYRPLISSAAETYGIDPAIIAGIISRESRAGNVLKDGWGDHGNAWGVMQVDKRYHTPRGGSESQEHIDQATGILSGFIHHDKFSSWSATDQLKGGIAAYNCGPEKVQSPINVDVRTTGGDYANDVVARAQWYKTNKNY